METGAELPPGAAHRRDSLAALRAEVAALRAHIAEIEARGRETHRMERLAVLAGGAAHDFNNLLTAITLNANLALAEAGAGWPGLRYLRAIELAGARAGALTRQMLAYAGEAAANLEALDISAIAREAFAAIEVALAPEAAVVMDLATDLPLVKADASQLRQVVMNLLTNASEALGDAPGRITLTTGARAMTAKELEVCQLGTDAAPGRFVVVEVSDDGEGMDEAARARIFNPFFSTKFSGRGLGLAGVAGIVRAHAGAIRVESAPGEGSRFTVFIPATDAIASPAAPEPEPAAWTGSGVVMAVDDDDTVRAVTGRLLERAGFVVIAARDGVEAVELFAANRGAVRMVLLDMTMPRMDGEETLRALRAVEPNVRVLLASGHSEEEMAGRVAEALPDGFIRKPYTGQALLERMRQILG